MLLNFLLDSVKTSYINGHHVYLKAHLIVTQPNFSAGTQNLQEKGAKFAALATKFTGLSMQYFHPLNANFAANLKLKNYINFIRFA